MRKTHGATHIQSLSSLPLQVGLHFNVLFSLLFLVLMGSCSLMKVLYYNKKVSISTMSVWLLFEVVRLYYGISGNMNERVSVNTLDGYATLTKCFYF